MKTIRTKEIDGYKIVIGIDKPLIDAEATKKKIAPMCQTTDETKAVEKKAEESRKLSAVRLELIKQAREAYRKGDASTHAKVNYEIELRNEQLATLQEELKDLILLKVAKDRELFIENAEYFEPTSGEEIITDEQAAEIGKKLMDLSGNELLSCDGNVIKNNKGVKYVKGGKIVTIDRIGEEPEGPLLKDVTPEQFEAMRMEALTDEEKQAEKDQLIDGIAGQAATMRSKLEIKGEKDALKQSQDWYKAEVKKVEDKYK